MSNCGSFVPFCVFILYASNGNRLPVPTGGFAFPAENLAVSGRRRCTPINNNTNDRCDIINALRSVLMQVFHLFVTASQAAIYTAAGPIRRE